MHAYCSSYYGCELWDLGHSNIKQFCSSWRKGVRRVWKLPFNTHNDLLPGLCGARSVEDELSYRALNQFYLLALGLIRLLLTMLLDILYIACFNYLDLDYVN